METANVRAESLAFEVSLRLAEGTAPGSWAKLVDFGAGCNEESLWLGAVAGSLDGALAVVNSATSAATLRVPGLFASRRGGEDGGGDAVGGGGDDGQGGWVHLVVAVKPLPDDSFLAGGGGGGGGPGGKKAALSVYRDGLLVAETSEGVVPLAAGKEETGKEGRHHWLGKSSCPGDAPFKGTISTFKLWRGRGIEGGEDGEGGEGGEGLPSAEQIRALYRASPGFAFAAARRRRGTRERARPAKLLAEDGPFGGGQGGDSGGGGGGGGEGPCEEYRVVMTDEFGDGWAGAHLHLLDRDPRGE